MAPIKEDKRISVRNENEIPVQNEEEIHHKSNGLLYIKQAIIVSNASLWCIMIALLDGWSNPASHDFIKKGTNIYGDEIEFSDTQLDMLSSLSDVGNIFGSLYACPVAWWGRRYTLMFLAVPTIITWAITGFSPSSYWILLGRFLAGFCVTACAVAVNTYMVEIPDVNVRGTIAMLSQLLVSVGFLLTPSLGLVFRYYHYAYLGIGLAIVSSFCNYFLPESPTYLVIKNREDKAKQILRRLRSPIYDIKKEIEVLRYENKGMEDSSFKHIFKKRSVRNSLVIVLTLFFFQQFSGTYVFYLHTTRIFIDAHIIINEILAVVYIFPFQFVGTIAGLLIIDRLGRRYSLVLSFILVSLFTYVLGAYTYFNVQPDTEPIVTDILLLNSTTIITNADIYILNMPPNVHQWIPIISLMGIVFSASLGTESIPEILSAEYFPTSVRAQAESLCLVFASICSMVVFSLYSPMKETLTTPGLYFFYATCGVLGSLFSLIFIRETAGEYIG